MPLFLDKDIGGPMTRTVTDAVAIFDVIAGYDPADAVTAASQGKRADSYIKFLVRTACEACGSASCGSCSPRRTPIRT